MNDNHPMPHLPQVHTSQLQEPKQGGNCFGGQENEDGGGRNLLPRRHFLFQALGGWLWAMPHPYSLSGGRGWECVLLKHLLSKTFKMLLISLLKRGSEAVTDTESS